MKTNTIKSIATLLGAAAVLSSTTFAGPGPQDHAQPVRTERAKTAVTVAQAKAPTADFKSTASATQQRPTHLVYSAHGGVIAL